MEKFCELVSSVFPTNDYKNILNPQWVGIIIHHTGESNLPSTKEGWAKQAKGIINWLTAKDDTYASAHFVIARDGMITQLADPRTQITFHAGKSKFFHPIMRREVENWNNYAVGIELQGNGNIADFSGEQYHSLIALCRELKFEFPTIDARCITGHENISPDRKVDPGAFFDWDHVIGSILAP